MGADDTISVDDALWEELEWPEASAVAYHLVVLERVVL